MTAMTPCQPVRPPVNELMLNTTLKAARAIEALSENGFTVTAVELHNPAHPTIRVQMCHRCRRLVENGEAAYYSFGRLDPHGLYREGQFQLGGCRVVWTEHGH